MFRTVRGFLVLAPLAYVAGLLAYLSAGPRAATTFTVYPFLAEVLGSGMPRSATARFVVVATLFFVVPYLVSGVLLFLADVGASASASLWRKEPRPAATRRPATLSPEAFWTLFASSVLLAGVVGSLLPGVAHGGELPGGVNVAPVFVALVPFVALGVGLLRALLASVPRALARVARRVAPRERGL
ncbi:MAG: hypothetical protein KJ062_19130 [Thermoanaerobaculia bacterium]|nr:hypothetical protein [Thermoanaerobaculia bacterium]